MKARAVLVVEDERIIARDLQAILRDLGYDAFAIAASADEAIAQIRLRAPDLVLMDIRIKGTRDGIDTAALLRREFDIPVVYLTAHSDDATLERAIATRPYGYLVKPVNVSDLRTTIELSLHKHELERRDRERERWFSTTLKSIGDGVVAVDTAGKIRFMNPVAEKLAGIPVASAIDQPLADVIKLTELSHPRNPLEEALEFGVHVSVVEATLAHANGSARLVANSAAPVTEDGVLLGAVMVFRDITDQRAMQKRLELADRMASLGTTVAGVAHEINNPLAIVVGNATHVRETLEVRDALDPLLDAQRELESAASRIARIVTDLATFARPPTDAGDSDVGAAIRWAVRSTASIVKERATVVADVDPLPRIELDETRLGQVLVNLLVNAAHAIAPGSPADNRVTVTASRRADAIVIEVRDTGTGMDEDLARRVFEPFFTTKPVGEGTGLGLAICYGIVTAAGGTIDVDSKLGAGTTFRIALPISRRRAKDTPSATVAVTGARILVIDDEPLLLRAMQRMLREHDVTVYDNARRAHEAIVAGAEFDLIFSDLMMPDMTGMELYEALRTSHPMSAARMVFLTGGATSLKVAQFLADVPNHNLQKPVTVSELREFIARELTRRS